MASCSHCGTDLGPTPTSYGTPAPAYYLAASAADQKAHFQLSDDTCIMDGEHFFVRANLEIPIIDRQDPFVWGVWSSLSKPNFERMIGLWEKPGRESEPPYFGWLSTELSHTYGLSTMNLKAEVYTQPPGIRPKVVLEPTNHPLALEQRRGIPWQRVEEIAAILHHGHFPGPEEAQEAVCRKYGVQRVPTPDDGRIAVTKGLQDAGPPLNGFRHYPHGDMTGWYLYSGEALPEDPEAFVVVHASHLREMCPHAIPFLGLPPGWRFLRAPDHTDVWYDKDLLKE